MNRRFVAGRFYTRDEVIRAMCEAMNPSRMGTSVRSCVEDQLALGDLSAPWWRLVDVPLSDLEILKFPEGNERVRAYAARLRAGEEPPPVVLDEYEPGRVQYPYDGNHRIAAARLCGRRTIRAFVPA